MAWGTVGNFLATRFEIDWKPTDKFRVYGPFPIKPTIEYIISEKLLIGLGLAGGVSSYRLSGEKFDHSFIQINQWLSNTYAECKLTRHLKGRISASYNLKRTIRQFRDMSASKWTIITFSTGEKPSPIKGSQQQRPYH